MTASIEVVLMSRGRKKHLIERVMESKYIPYVIVLAVALLLFGAAISASQAEERNIALEISERINAIEMRVHKSGATPKEIDSLIQGLVEADIILRAVVNNLKEIENEARETRDLLRDAQKSAQHQKPIL